MKLYDLLLENEKIGTTELEKADAPMGTVFGRINFVDIKSGYDFLKKYCLKNKIEILTDYVDEKLIVTSNIPNLVVTDENGKEIKGQAINIEGLDNEYFEVTILAVPYPFFEEEFPHHVKAYDDQFKTENEDR